MLLVVEAEVGSFRIGMAVLVDLVLLNPGGATVVAFDVVEGAGDGGRKRSSSMAVSGVRGSTVRLSNFSAASLSMTKEAQVLHDVGD